MNPGTQRKVPGYGIAIVGRGTPRDATAIALMSLALALAIRSVISLR
jgi:hypothetical protein